MAIQAMWVHGNSVRTQETIKKLQDIPERDHSALLGFPQGWGTTFRGRGGKRNWFHFCIPTPCYRYDNQGAHRAKLNKIFVLFDAEPDPDEVTGVSLSSINVYDGLDLILHKDHLGIGGKHVGIDNTNSWELPNKPEVSYGVGVSVEIVFPRDGNILFVAAGADFDV